MDNKNWKPTSIVTFIEDYLKGATNFELAKTHGGSPDQTKRLIKRLVNEECLPTRMALKDDNETARAFEYKGLRGSQDFRKFLLVARTMEEIQTQFGDMAIELMDEQYPGLSLFSQINNFGKEIFILLPEVDRDSIKVKPREWKYYHSESNEGNFVQPYQLVQLPDSLFASGEVLIAPLYDVHFGHMACKRAKLLAYLRWIEETPNVLTFIGGDLLENALDDGRGMSYSQEIPPDQQINEICKLLAPIAHKVLFALPGNHEHRTQKRAGIDPMKIVANTLDIPHFSGPVYCSIMGAGHKWRIYAMHGSSFAQTKGGKMNAAGKPRVFTDLVNFYVSGHVHDPVTNMETCISEDPVLCRLIYKTQWTVICPSFMRWENSYAYQAGWPPPGKGGVALRLYANGDYNAALRDGG
jgi:hypothetical protein